MEILSSPAERRFHEKPHHGHGLRSAGKGVDKVKRKYSEKGLPMTRKEIARAIAEGVQLLLGWDFFAMLVV